MKSVLIALIALTSTVASAQSVVSSYTNLGSRPDNKDKTLCRTTASSEWGKNPEIDYFKSTCPGFAGYKVFHDGGDLRSHIDLIAPGRTSRESLTYFDEAHGSFPYVTGSKLEWRSTTNNKGVKTPFAVIFRIAAQNESGADASQWRDLERLVVAKVSPTDSCVIGSVAATGNPNANIQARQLADAKARAARCE